MIIEIAVILHYQSSLNSYCGVMKFLADMPSCLGGEEPGINLDVEPTVLSVQADQG